MNQILVATVLCIAGAEGDASPLPSLPAYCFAVVNFRIHDVDTVIGDVELPWFVTLRKQEIRCNGYDGWEVSRTRQTEPFKHFTPREWEIEIAKGVAARDALKRLTEGSKVYIQWNPKDEKSAYGRLEGQLWVRLPKGEIVNVEEWARSNKFVRE